MWRRLVGVALPALLLLAACGTGAGAGGTETRTVRMDYDHDEFAGAFPGMFPRNVTVAQGDTVEVRQTWTGDPHTVTMGKLFDDSIKVDPALSNWVKQGGPSPLPNLPEPIRAQFRDRLNQLPFAFSPDFEVLQTVAQPCFLDDDLPPADPETPCPKRAQPAFNGRQSYYSSGIIPYEGDGTNRFDIPLSPDIAPGDYAYYCAVHGPGQAGVITVVPKGSDIPSQSQVTRRAQREIDAMAEPLLEALKAARQGRYEIDGQRVTDNLAGFFRMRDPLGTLAVGNEFVPSTIHTRTGQPVTWTVLGIHTISFDVPSYLPVLGFADDGRVTLNERVAFPQGGWPGQLGAEAAERAGAGEPVGAGDIAAPAPDRPVAATPLDLDAGRWDGRSFVSSGLMSSLERAIKYRVSFTRPGTYKYACLIHPRMVGEVEVS